MILRILFIFLIVPLLLFWQYTCYHGFDLAYCGSTSYDLRCFSGKLNFIRMDHPWPYTPGFHFQPLRPHRDLDGDFLEISHTLLGFVFQHNPVWSLFALPLWFPTLLLAALIWRTLKPTRQRPGETAFHQRLRRRYYAFLLAGAITFILATTPNAWETDGLFHLAICSATSGICWTLAGLLGLLTRLPRPAALLHAFPVEPPSPRKFLP